MSRIIGRGPAFIDVLLRAVGVRSTDEATPGPEAIVRARHELDGDDHIDEATIGKPRLEDWSGEYTTDVKAVIPLHTEKYTDPAPLTVDVDGDKLAEICEGFSLDVENVALLEGATVPIQWESGTPVPDLEALEDESRDLSASISGLDNYDEPSGL